METTSAYGSNQEQKTNAKTISLLDKIKDIQLVMEGFSIFQGNKSNRKKTISIEFNVNPSGINKIIKDMGNRPIGQPPKSIDLNQLVVKVRQLVGTRKPDFSLLEIRCFPYILNQFYNNRKCFDFMINQLDLTRTSFFRRCVNTYMLNYESGNPESYGQDKLRSVLLKALQANRFLLNSIGFLALHPHLLEKDGHKFLGKDLADGIKDVMDKKYDLPLNIQDSSFGIEAICYFFNSGSNSSEILSERFNEVYFNYPDLIGRIAESVILSADKENNEEFKSDLMLKLDRKLNDPRNPANANKWSNVSDEAIATYISWRNRNDLDFFFKLVDASTDLNSNSHRMWKYRKAFWQCYVDHMTMTKILLGEEAERIAKQIEGNQTINYSTLTSYDPTQSIFMFRIENLVFIDVSHNGSLRIYHKGTEPIPFFEKYTWRANYNYSRNIVAKSLFCIATIPHSGSENYKWQEKVANKIWEECKIFTKASDWRP